MMELAPEIATHLGDGSAAFDRVFALTGQLFRYVEGRQTLRVEIGGENYFLKRHHGYGWKLIVKSVLAGRWPVLSARNEFEAIRRLDEAGIPSVEVVGCGERGRNPATRQSFLLMRELSDCRDLEKICREWPQQSPSAAFRRAVIEAIGTTSKQMHDAGINHRDYYLCHLWLELANVRASDLELIRRPLIKPKINGVTQAEHEPIAVGIVGASVQTPLKLRVMDLHRAMQHRRVPLFWLIKDLAGLLFSAWEFGLTKSDCVRFLRAYRGGSVRNVLTSERWLWRCVIWRAMQLFQKTHRRDPDVRLVVPKVERRANQKQATTHDNLGSVAAPARRAA
jgi:heptose I phosphotransferase